MQFTVMHDLRSIRRVHTLCVLNANCSAGWLALVVSRRLQGRSCALVCIYSVKQSLSWFCACQFCWSCHILSHYVSQSGPAIACCATHNTELTDFVGFCFVFLLPWVYQCVQMKSVAAQIKVILSQEAELKQCHPTQCLERAREVLWPDLGLEGLEIKCFFCTLYFTWEVCVL